ncbi:hypothetical protein KC316_g19991, partial [Hortaea werneckii]
MNGVVTAVSVIPKASSRQERGAVDFDGAGRGHFPAQHQASYGGFLLLVRGARMATCTWYRSTINMTFLRSALLAALPLNAFAQLGPTAAPYPDSTYQNATEEYTTEDALTNATSPPKYPSPWGEGLGDWDRAYAQARDFVSQLTLLEKVNLTTGVGWQGEKCVGNVGAIP